MQGYFAVNPPLLPAGWQIAYTANGQPYYLDHNTKTTHWNLPETVGYSFGGYYDPVMVAGGNRGGRGGRGGRNGIDQGKRKTKMCIYWEKNGECSWGDRCAFAHGPGELRASVGPDSSQMQQVGHDVPPMA
ncbi:zinc finger protein 3 [Trypanosoma equiperdum]|uniref:Zinc finger protein 2, putative n=2 Tax=Trypanozoon TaxID=39700 RepID=Q57WV5_TRYB2|nr:zinc finger protein 2, putative [Trypanosoma brucei brucei TREU927]AAX69912.1 zinc finger protein 2, putative [Trypanosoma brucei]AAZ10109.1 zinc finger protein 2, putative [Trypanosoma brucei brucei TREU927]SCU71206.1 zinc finger protein 3 [Trypanosoma equiperdum]